MENFLNREFFVWVYSHAVQYVNRIKEIDRKRDMKLFPQDNRSGKESRACLDRVVTSGSKSGKIKVMTNVHELNILWKEYYEAFFSFSREKYFLFFSIYQQWHKL